MAKSRLWIFKRTHYHHQRQLPQSGAPEEETTLKLAGVSSTMRARPSGPSGPSGLPSSDISTAAAFPIRTWAWRENPISSELLAGTTFPAMVLPSVQAQTQLGATVFRMLEWGPEPAAAWAGAFGGAGVGVAGGFATGAGAGA